MKGYLSLIEDIILVVNSLQSVESNIKTLMAHPALPAMFLVIVIANLIVNNHVVDFTNQRFWNVPAAA